MAFQIAYKHEIKEAKRKLPKISTSLEDSSVSEAHAKMPTPSSCGPYNPNIYSLFSRSGFINTIL